MELGKSGKREHLIYYDNVAERDREILEGELGRKLVPYELSFTIGTDASRGFANFTPLSLSLYEIFKLLDGYRNVLRLDTDGFGNVPRETCIPRPKSEYLKWKHRK